MLLDLQSIQVRYSWTQMSPLALKYTFRPTFHLSYIFLNSNKPSCSQIQHCTFNPLKSNFLKLKWIPLLSNVPSYLQTTQIIPFSTPMCICTLKLLTWGVFLNSSVLSHPQIIQIKPSSTKICLSILKPLKFDPSQLGNVFTHPNYSKQSLFNSNPPFQPQTIQIMFFSTQMCFCTFKFFNSSPL